MATVTVVILNGEATVTADGTKTSCDATTAVEKAMGKTMKSTPTGTRPVDAKLVQK